MVRCRLGGGPANCCWARFFLPHECGIRGSASRWIGAARCCRCRPHPDPVRYRAGELSSPFQCPSAATGPASVPHWTAPCARYRDEPRRRRARGVGALALITGVVAGCRSGPNDAVGGGVSANGRTRVSITVVSQSVPEPFWSKAIVAFNASDNGNGVQQSAEVGCGVLRDAHSATLPWIFNSSVVTSMARERGKRRRSAMKPRSNAGRLAKHSGENAVNSGLPTCR